MDSLGTLLATSLSNLVAKTSASGDLLYAIRCWTAGLVHQYPLCNCAGVASKTKVSKIVVYYNTKLHTHVVKKRNHTWVKVSGSHSSMGSGSASMSVARSATDTVPGWTAQHSWLGDPMPPCMADPLHHRTTVMIDTINDQDMLALDGQHHTLCWPV